MRVIKLGIISAVVLFIIIWLFSLLVPSNVRVSRAIDIDGTQVQLLPYLADLQQWPQWNEMVKNEQYTNKQYTATSFKADQLQISALAPLNDSLMTNWTQASGRTLTAGYTWHENADKMVVQWYFDIPLRWYPWEKFSAMIFDKQLGPSMEKSLATLKKLVEKKP